MKPINSLSYFYLSSFSNPACDRVIYRTIRKHKVASFLEIGIGDANRAANMIRLAKKYSGSGSVRYTGIDAFEADPGSKVSLKVCHQRLNKFGVKLQLVPGDFVSSIHRIANSHMRTDLLIVSSRYHTDELENVWFYFPRMLHAASVVFLQDSGDDQGYFERLGRLEIERLTKKKPKSLVSAA